MSDKKWTDAQKRSIYENEKNILVSAAAGSGKTAVLVERVINMLTKSNSPVPVNRLLVITFTNAAANEMQVRIREALKKKSEDEPHNKLVKKQLALLPGANINTIHSFCQNLIKNNFYELSISPNVKIGDQTRLEIMANEALETVMERYYAEKSEGIKYLYSAFAEKYNDDRLLEIIKKIYAFSKSTPEPKVWLENSVKNYITCEIWQNYLLDLKDNFANTLISLSKIALEYAETGAENYVSSLNCDLEKFESLLKLDKNWNKISKYVSEFSITPLSRKKKTDDEFCVEAVKDIRKNLSKHLSKLCNIFSGTQSELEKNNKVLYEAAKVLCNIVIDFDNEFSEMKKQAEVIDFNDLEHMALKIIKSKPSIKEMFDEILIDEFQDTNGVQNAIAEALSNGNNLFMVGDVKQSIYGFRNARPDIFIEKENIFKENENGTEIFLSHNFRSSSGIIDFINKIFSKIMTANIGGIDYTKGHSLQFGGFINSPFETEAEVHIINKKFDDNIELTEDELETDEVTREAIFIAQEIIKMINSGLCTFKDIAVLTRETKVSAPVFARVFAEYSIPYYCTTETTDYLLTPEISTVISMLQIIDNPYQDIPLTAVMKSPMFLFTDEELAFIKKQNKRSLYDSVKLSNNQKCISFVKKLDEYREVAKNESIEYLIRHIITDSGFFSFSGAMPNGSIRTTNLMLLCERANDFEKNNAKSLFEFINYLEFMKTVDNKYSSAETNGENDNVVNLMTIHKSKGLEFPVVFLARCGKLFNKRDISANILYDADLGIGFEFYDFKKNIKYPALSKLAIANKKEELLFAEELRVLYVALTRAKQKLIVTGSKIIKENSFSNFADYKDRVKEFNNYMDIICYGLGNELDKFLHIHSAEEIIIQHSLEIDTLESSTETKQTKVKVSDEIRDMLEYSYPYADAKKIPSKIPVSRLIKQDDSKITLPVPSFVENKNVVPANLRGIAIHFILQNIDIHRTSSVEEINVQIKQMTDSGVLNEKYLNPEDINKLYNFFNSELGNRMKASQNVQREAPFFAQISAGEIMELENDALKNEQVLLQGVVDCYFEENGEIIILDYKTGYIRPEYEKQLEFYAYGLEKTLGKKVSETHICVI